MSIEKEIRAIIGNRLPSGMLGVLNDDTPLMEDGMELDSVEMTEVLLDCEQKFGIAFSQQFFASPVFTIDLIAAYIRDAQSA
jgi:acyl carrier protein